MAKANSTIQSEATSDSLVVRAHNWALEHLRSIGIAFGVASFLLFFAWLMTTLFLPARDAQRERVTVLLNTQRILLMDYPKRFLADDQSRPVYLTVDTAQPISVTLKLPSNLPLILTKVEPSSAVKVDNSASDTLYISWPFTSSIQTPVGVGLSSTPAIGLPFVEDPGTVTLFLKNARSERSARLFGGFTIASLQIAGAEPSLQPILVETIDRAQWRVFADKYSFLAILPFLIAALGFLRKTQLDRQNKQREEAQRNLEYFKHAMTMEGQRAVEKSYRALSTSLQYIPGHDSMRAQKMWNLSEGRILSAEISASDFSIWSDSWVGALNLADGCAVISDQDKKSLRYLVRIFPRDFLSITSEKSLRKLVSKLREDSPIGSLDWPLRPTAPEEYSKIEAGSESILTVERMGLFPAKNAEDATERSYLFSDNTGWFWRGHSLYSHISDKDAGCVLVHGKPGIGRTALALALTLYADANPDAERVFSYYHAGPARVKDVQVGLTREMLRFIRWRTSWLMRLDREDRDLMANLLLTVHDPQYLLAQLNSPNRKQQSEAISTEQQMVWEEQDLLELRLLRQSIDRMASSRPMSSDHWFLGLSHCVQRLSFDRMRVALDMTAANWSAWHTKHLPEFLRLAQLDDFRLSQYVFLVADAEAPEFLSQFEIEIQELNWLPIAGRGGNEETPLGLMLQHRAIRHGIPQSALPFSLPALGALCNAADGNPRRLAELWQRIQLDNPQAEAITKDMIPTKEVE